jgi:hypothetical protein
MAKRSHHTNNETQTETQTETETSTVNQPETQTTSGPTVLVEVPMAEGNLAVQPSTEPETEAPKYDLERFHAYKTKSQKIRYLNSCGLSRSEILKVFKSQNIPMIYQHIRNVLITPVKSA